MVLLRLFGGASLESGQKPITGRSAQRRRIALLALLAVARRGLSRDKLIGYLWAENDTEKARRLLSESLYVLRRELGEDAITVAGDELRLNPAVIQCDVVAFEDAVERMDCEKAAELYAGPFLDGFYVSDAIELERWVDTERDRLARTYLRMLEELAGRSAAEGRRDDAVEWWRRMAHLDPYSGRFAVGLMQALEAAGHRAAAMQHATVHRALLREELDAEPDPAVVGLADKLRASPDPAWTPTVPSIPNQAEVSTAGPDPAGAAAAVSDGSTITFLFSDIEGSTNLLRRLGPRYADLLATHHAIVRDCLHQCNGWEIDTAGDGFFIAFPRARDAISAAVRIQKRIAGAAWPDGVDVRVRMGLHTGEPAFTRTGFVGLDVHRAARICAIARGGQILLSTVTRELIATDVPRGLTVRDHGQHALKDIEEPEHLWELVLEGAVVPAPVAATVARLDASRPGDAPALPPTPAIASAAVERPPRPTAGQSWQRWRRPALFAALSVFIGLALASIVRDRAERTGGAAVLPADPVTRIVVFPFQYYGADEQGAYLGGAIVPLVTQLLEFGDLRPIPFERVFAEYVGRADASNLSMAQVERITERFGASLYLLGSITASAGGRLDVSARLHERGGSDPGTVSASGSIDDLSAVADSLARQLIVSLIGPRLGQHVTAGIRVAKSPEALKAWVEGELEFASGQYSRAVDALERAVQADTSLAPAYYRLSMAYEWNLQFPEAHLAVASALRNADRLRPRQFRLLRAWDHLLSGRAEDAEVEYNRIRTEQPDEVEAWYGLGEVRAHFNATRGLPIGDARSAFRKVLELITPTVPGTDARPVAYGDARYHLLEFAAAERDSAAFDSLVAGLDRASDQRLAFEAVRAFGWGDSAARAAVERSLQRELDELKIGMAAARVGAHLHDFDGGRRIASIIANRSAATEDWRAGARLMMGEFSFAAGRFSSASQDVTAAARLEPEWPLEIRGLLALPRFVPLSNAEVATTRDEIDQWDTSHDTPSNVFFFGVHVFAHRYLRPYLAGMLSVRLGELERARAFRRQLDDLDPGDNPSLQNALETSLRAHILIAENETTHALGLLRGINLNAWMEQVGFSPFYSRAYDRLVIAELHRELGQQEESLRWYRSLTEGYDVLFVAPAHYRMAQVFERMGQADSVRIHRDEFEKLWANADSTARAGLRATRW